MLHRITFLLFLLTTITISTAEPLRDDYDELFHDMLTEPKTSPLNTAFAALVLNQDIPRANAALEKAWTNVLGDHDILTPDLADSQFKWQLRTWVRLYYLFGPRGTATPNRISADNARRIESLFWNYAMDKSQVVRANTKNVWFIQGSENHDMMDLGNAFLATQALAHVPDYADRMLSDGLTPATHAAGWITYFNAYMEARFLHGLSIEFASPIYGKYFIPELLNIRDFSEDATLKKNTHALLDLIWADWAIEQLNGIRGGAKARCYQGKYTRNGTSDCWLHMGNLLLKQGDWTNGNLYTHPIMGFGPAIATSAYALAPLVVALATSPTERGNYVSVSRRPGRMTHIDPVPPYDHQSCWYNLAPDNSRMLRYTWCTPHHLLGSFWIDPALREDFQIYPKEPDRADKHYAAIATQNLWQGIVFDTHPNARIVPQCQAKPDKNKPEFSTTYVQQLSVQHENVMIFQANRAHPAIRAMGLYFGPGMKDRIVERGVWKLLEEGNSYVAIRIIDRANVDTPGPATWTDENMLTTEDPWAPIALVTGQKDQHATLEAFTDYLDRLGWSIAEGKLRVDVPSQNDERVSLALYLDEARQPEKNGQPTDLSPPTWYDNPFFDVSADRRTVTLRFQGKTYPIALANELGL